MLSTSVCGVKLETCLMNASGCWCANKGELDELYESFCGAVVSKSGTITERKGNTEPRLFLDGIGSINAMGLPNLGYEFYLNYSFFKKSKKPFIQSIHPFSVDELKLMLSDIEKKSDTKKLVEVNISCPNLGTVENMFKRCEQYMERIQERKYENLSCGLKLAPLYESVHFDVMSSLLLKYDIDFITCTNSIPNGLIIDPIHETTRIVPKSGCGGIGGYYLKPVALSNVYNFYKRLDYIDIIGCGGVCSSNDAFEYILCGAKAVQIGTHLLKTGPQCFGVINSELQALVKTKGYSNIEDFRGKLKIL